MKMCPFVFIADALGYEGRTGVSITNAPGLCLESQCGIYDDDGKQCGFAKHVQLSVRKDHQSEEFQKLVYEELADDPDNLRANRIITAAEDMLT